MYTTLCHDLVRYIGCFLNIDDRRALGLLPGRLTALPDIRLSLPMRADHGSLVAYQVSLVLPCGSHYHLMATFIDPLIDPHRGWIRVVLVPATLGMMDVVYVDSVPWATGLTTHLSGRLCDS